MDFGDILDEWERQTAIPQGNKGKRKAPEAKKTQSPGTASKLHTSSQGERLHPLTLWLRTHDVYDKDAAGTEINVSPGERRRRLLHKKPDATIDLHGLTQNEAWSALETFFQDSRRRGFEKLHIIHGKGNHSTGEAVLKQTVKRFIETCPFAGENGHGNAASGGSGATWVLIKHTK
ncbi:MAG: Smr/MutS family protein [Treponema sp.]|jgi:DNA-nicking Smr family endonuclease|nr:Smr/MutS family protein [Treponema sp.]